MIKELLLDNIKINPKEKKLKIDNNFLLFLLKNEKEPIKLLKSLNISKEDLENIAKNLPKNQQKDFLNLLSKLDLKHLSKKQLKINEYKNFTNINQINKSEDKKEISKNDIDIITIEKLLNPNLNISLPEQNEIKIVNEIKKEIKTLIKTKKLSIPQNELKNFKQISTLKELIEFSNRNGLNIQKIIYQKKEEIKPLLIPTEKTNIVLNAINTPPKQKIILNNKTTSSLTNKLKTNLNSNEYKNNDFSISLNNLLKDKNNSTDAISTIKSHKKTFFNDLEPYILQETKNNKSTETNKNEFNQNIHISNHQININLKQNIISAKQTLKNFANNLKEAIENYKPPIHKLSIELNPKELGKVELTLIHRGDNLQIQINSNQQPTINFFNQHQNDLKTILVNMGYSDVNMSFNSNQQQQQKKEYSNNQKSFKNEEKEENFIIEIPYQYA
ncbi:flagellar hook-length control protein FliK [Caminibacter mediatlanticus]|uniref:Flagellar hook-length control protein-like C-terminal domain-containing protein n=1 Tax=Caminibacter mediatlanticus TB-2 TaxID=391592 RepID=A0AAI9AGE8_9BACT|nr:flagellar hook-length control protein FliK [Caminibacter mediatlanticus]EDM23019.1 hypothetical protein CMTB2_08575 [Caminibacter mediatlanticus TB-2]